VQSRRSLPCSSDRLGNPDARRERAALPDSMTDRPVRGDTKVSDDVGNADDASLSRNADARDHRKDPDAGDSSRRVELDQRLGQLPPGHPSSHYAADGSRKPPVTRLSDLEIRDGDVTSAEPADAEPADKIRPLTDEEHAEHLADVRSRLEQAHADGLDTDKQHTIDPANEIWSADRAEQHDVLIADIYRQAAGVPNESRAIIAGGLGGAGKSTVLANYAGIDRSQYLTLNPDDIKEKMAERGLIPLVAGLSPLEAADLVHEESSHIAKLLAFKAEADGKNVLWDITMSSYASTEWRIEMLRSAGYDRIDGVFVDIPVETSVRRAEGRLRDDHDKYRSGEGLGGRYIEPEIIMNQGDKNWGSINRKFFEQLKHRFDTWSLYDNSVDGRIPMLIQTSDRALSKDDQ